MLKRLPISTSTREQFVDITADVASAIREAGVTSGVATVFVPHSTAAITIK